MKIIKNGRLVKTDVDDCMKFKPSEQNLLFYWEKEIALCHSIQNPNMTSGKAKRIEVRAIAKGLCNFNHKYL